MDDIKKKIYLKLYYSLLDWEWYSDTNTFRVFMHLLLTANRTERKIKGGVIKRGEALASQEFLAEATGLSVQNVKTALKNLLSTGEITKRKLGKTNVFTLVNYDKYQASNQIYNRDLTTSQPKANHDLTTPIYCKNEENERGRRDSARTQNKNNNGTARKPSYDIDLAMKMAYKKLDPTKTKRER